MALYSDDELLTLVEESTLSANDKGPLYAFVNSNTADAQRVTRRVPKGSVVSALQAYLERTSGRLPLYQGLC